MSDKVKVSIVVPVYNVEAYLEECVLSLTCQTLDEIEIILVDDGSTDASGTMCDMFALNDKRISVIHKVNEGLGFARNTGIGAAVGTYVTFVDSDDYVTDNMAELLYKKAIKYGVDAVYSCAMYRLRGDGQIEIPDIVLKEDMIYQEKDIVEKLLPDIISSSPEFKTDWVIGVSVCKALFFLELLKKNCILFESEELYISEDAMFQLDFIPICSSVVVIPDIYYYYRLNQNSLTVKYKKNRFELDKTLYLEQLKRIENYDNYTVLKNRIQRMFLANIRLCLIQECLAIKNIIAKRREIVKICNDFEVKDVIGAYPIMKLPITKRVVCLALKFRLYVLLYLMINIKYRDGWR